MVDGGRDDGVVCSIEVHCGCALTAAADEDNRVLSRPYGSVWAQMCRCGLGATRTGVECAIEFRRSDVQTYGRTCTWGVTLFKNGKARERFCVGHCRVLKTGYEEDEKSERERK